MNNLRDAANARVCGIVLWNVKERTGRTTDCYARRLVI